MKQLLLALLIILAFGGEAGAAVYECLVSKKIDSEGAYTGGDIKKYRPSVKIEELENSSFLSRCSFTPSARKITCDRYAVDKIVLDANMGIKKFYVFRSQFDVQIFSTLTFVENNGRGGIAFGKCRLLSP